MDSIGNGAPGCSSGDVVKVPIRIVGVVAAIVGVVGLYVALLQIPKSAVDLPYQQSQPAQAVKSLLPQGWAFFTKSPRGETFSVYAGPESGNVKLTATPISEPRNWFGLDRTPRAQGTEYAALLQGVAADDWRACISLAECISANIPALPRENLAPGPTFCGDIYVVRLESTPWAWREFESERRNPTDSVRIDVKC
ncbi:SdpA family antimicrobial peptide system protein [Rhodococcus sp. YH3-3]|uniref:SdpA family antimicrobial peptide system protein n=1 Tax=Rhodococcus sp. YH3-3 TaxID=1803579 RepID=UPI000A64E3BE|nr:SdpA family antimicrobial peptide system protein [Rhodococcus sp. YH3-3]